MKKFCKDLRKHATQIIACEKRNDTINKWRKSVISRAKGFFYDKKDYKFIKSEIIVFRLETKEVLLIIFVI